MGAARRIDELFPPHFFQTNLWRMWRTMFAFQKAPDDDSLARETEAMGAALGHVHLGETRRDPRS